MKKYNASFARLVMIIAVLFAQTSWSSAKIASIQPPKTFLICFRDNECVSIENDCAHCCGHGTAVNRTHSKEFSDLVKNNCGTYNGGVCDCDVDKKIRWQPKCVNRTCEMVGTPISQSKSQKKFGSIVCSTTSERRENADIRTKDLSLLR